jgi:hypothetical protein
MDPKTPTPRREPETIQCTGAELAQCDRLAERWHLRRARSEWSMLDDIDIQPFERGEAFK